ncbi:MAG: MoxR family ATPase [Pirellulales bacterium]|nr:MoxR family ATPase [Pirellulales bacterium]
MSRCRCRDASRSYDTSPRLGDDSLNKNPPKDPNRSDDSAGLLQRRIDEFQTRFQGLIDEIQRAIVGYDQLIGDVLVAIFSQGHVLLEGVPGLGKTYLVNVLSRVLGLTFGRVQCTPDLMPADVLGTHIVGDDEAGRRVFRFEKGPVFHHLLLVDEINRATPKTQAALLETMQERAVTAGGERFELPAPFFVLATQNPLEMEGTYPLPEAQLDRFFFKLHVPFPNADEMVEITRRTTKFTEPKLDVVMTAEEFIGLQELLTHVPVAEPLMQYAARLVLATHPQGGKGDLPVDRFVSYGASPRGMQALIRGARAYCLLAGRTAVSINDVQRVALPSLRHRLILNFEGEAEQVNVDDVIRQVLETVPTPARGAA